MTLTLTSLSYLGGGRARGASARLRISLAVAALAVGAVGLLVPGVASAQFSTSTYFGALSGPYVGVKGAYTNLQIKRKYRTTSGTTNTDNVFVYKTTPFSVGVYGGYNYNPYIGGEATVYIPVTKPEASITAPNRDTGLTPSGNFKESGTDGVGTTTENGKATYGLAYSVALVGSYPLSPEILAYVKVGVGGVTFGDEEVQFTPTGGTSTEFKLNDGFGINLGFGAGVRYRLNRTFSFALEYEQTTFGNDGTTSKNSPTMSNITVNAAYHF